MYRKSKIKKNLLVFASGTKTGGGSGFETLVEAARSGDLDANIVAVVSNHKFGGVRERADRLGIKFIYFDKSVDKYADIVKREKADFVSLSGWLLFATGLDPKTTINIHPGPLPEFGGKGMYGHHVHEALYVAYKKGEIDHSAATMHFVTPRKYDDGPIFFEYRVKITDDDTPESIGKKVNEIEHKFQAYITNLVIQGKIYWDGVNPDSLVVPEDYEFLKADAA